MTFKETVTKIVAHAAFKPIVAIAVLLIIVGVTFTVAPEALKPITSWFAKGNPSVSLAVAQPVATPSSPAGASQASQRVAIQGLPPAGVPGPIVTGAGQPLPSTS